MVEKKPGVYDPSLQLKLTFGELMSTLLSEDLEGSFEECMHHIPLHI